MSIACDNAGRGDIPLVRDALELICLVCRVWVNGGSFNSCGLPAHCLAIVAQSEPLGAAAALFLSACGLFSTHVEFSHSMWTSGGKVNMYSALQKLKLRSVWVALILTAGQDIAGFTSACHVVAREMRR